MIYEKCREILKKQSEIVQKAVNLQENMQEAVMNREFESLEEMNKEMMSFEENLASLEEQREKYFAAFEKSEKIDSANKDAKMRFYAIAGTLPIDQRNEITEIYRNLKMLTIRLQIANESFAVYLCGIRSMLNEFFNLAFPERSGKTYTPLGMHIGHDMRSMVINQSF